MGRGFGLIGLVIALALVAVLAKRQMAATRMAAPPVAPAAQDAPAATVRAQGQQLQQQVREQVESALRQPRELPPD